MLPRHLEIIYKINWGLLSDVRKRFSNTTLVTSGEGLSESENYGIIFRRVSAQAADSPFTDTSSTVYFYTIRLTWAVSGARASYQRLLLVA